MEVDGVEVNISIRYSQEDQGQRKRKSELNASTLRCLGKIFPRNHLTTPPTKLQAFFGGSTRLEKNRPETPLGHALN